MASSLKAQDGAATVAQHEKRDQEVVRANKELAAYFKGRRTEREARAALKIIKAFIRDRERSDPQKQRPLPGSTFSRAGKHAKARHVSRVRKKGRRKVQRQTPHAVEARLDRESAAQTDEGLRSDE